MCIAGINATTQPCQHRWAHLVQACEPSRNLQSCPDKLKFSGWEQKHETCPWCSSNAPPAHDSTHRLFGSATCPIIPAPATDMPELTPRRSRTGSTGTFSTLSRHSSINSVESEWAEKGQRHRDQNERLAAYLTMMPHEVLPSARKYYPTYSNSSSEDGLASEGMGGCRRRDSGMSSKRWTRNFRLNRSMFKG